MTATQVFLRFVKSQYTKENGEVDVKMYRHWMNALSTCKYTKRRTHYWLMNFYMKRRTFFIRRANYDENIKDYVDDYLSYGRSLRGFVGALIASESDYWNGNTYVDSLCKAYDKYKNVYYGFRKKEGSKNLIKEWHDFLDKHIEGEITKKWHGGKKYTFTWKE